MITDGSGVSSEVGVFRPNRVIAYIDGFNLYFGMREAQLERYLWLDLPEMIRQLLRPGQVLTATKYFTSRVSSPAARVKRQATFIEAISTLSGVRVIEGQFESKPETCSRCKGVFSCNCVDTYVKHAEKMTDVNTAVEISKDAYAGNFDTAFLVTGDSDQTPTIELVKELFPETKIVCVFPPCRKSSRLRTASGRCLNINEMHLRISQMPDLVVKADGTVLGRPTTWPLATTSTSQPPTT